jgi:hypothetical protein
MVKFATAINCIDGRVQIAVIDYLKNTLSVDYVDMITEPGPNKLLSENKNNDAIKLLREKAAISIEKHGSGIIAIVGHYDCAANPENEENQKKQLLESLKTISSWRLDLKRIVALWLNSSFTPTIVSTIDIKPE